LGSRPTFSLRPGLDGHGGKVTVASRAASQATPRELRQDPVTRQWVVVAPGRAQRPGASARADLDLPTEEELDSCPFCEGREDRTPPETFAIRPRGGGPDTPGWTVRVVPNLYPIFEHHEVVVSTPRHIRSFAELSKNEVTAVAVAWRERARAAREAGFPYMHALLNEGREAGASLPHSHTQLVWLEEPPPAVRAEEGGGECSVCRHLEAELASGERLVLERDGLVVLAAYGGRLPYELLIAPLEHPSESAFESELLAPALGLLSESLRRLHVLEGPVPVNAWLHDRGHWHVEVLPRLTVFAGIELGAGIYVNSLAPEDAAVALREGPRGS
jgi:UDPglucose--hexose-1-phosphate uridylyltransferase